MTVITEEPGLPVPTFEAAGLNVTFGRYSTVEAPYTVWDAKALAQDQKHPDEEEKE